jgi:murein DD-endopeptidase MepM/ murein hydrolase activator NlpD
MAAIAALPHGPRPVRAAASIVAVPLLLAAVLALHAIGPSSEPRLAETLPPPGQGSHIASLPSLPGTVSAATLTPRATGLLAADLFQAANAATRLSILSKVQPTASPAPPAPPVGPTLDQIERAQAGVAEAQLALQALQQGATDAQIQQAQSQVQQAQNQLAGAHASVTPLPTATPAPTVAPTAAPKAAPVQAAVAPAASAPATSAPAAVAVATPQPLPYSDTQLTQAAAALNAAQLSLAQAQQYNASLAVPAAAPLPGASRAGAVPVPGSRIATPVPATPAPAPADLTPYQAAVDDAQNTFNTMTTADQAIDQQNADLAASLAAAPAATTAADTATDSAAAPDDSSTSAAVVAATAPAAPVVSAATAASAPPQPSATPLPAATATNASSPTDSNGTDSDTTTTNAQSQLSGALSQLQALQSPPPAEAVKAAQDSLTQAQQQLDALLKQASPDVAAQVDPDPMTVLQKLRAGTLALDQQISNGFIWPAKGPVTQGFGLTAFALDGAYNGGGHTGVDIGQGAGQPIVAAAAGTVIFSGGDTASGYGDYVELDDGNGYQTIYGHMMTPSFLKQGDHVAQGQLIGVSGSTGYSTGPHVHFEVRLNGVPIDPLPLLGGLLPKPLHP